MLRSWCVAACGCIRADCEYIVGESRFTSRCPWGIRGGQLNRARTLVPSGQHSEFQSVRRGERARSARSFAPIMYHLFVWSSARFSEPLFILRSLRGYPSRSNREKSCAASPSIYSPPAQSFTFLLPLIIIDVRNPELFEHERNPLETTENRDSNA